MSSIVPFETTHLFTFDSMMLETRNTKFPYPSALYFLKDKIASTKKLTNKKQKQIKFLKLENSSNSDSL